MTILRLFVGVAMGAGLVASATATSADGPSRRPAPNDYSGPAINWTGFYAGIQGGYGWGNTEHTTDGLGGGTSGEFDTNGRLIGVTLGTNWQRGNWVYGLEGDFSFSSIEGTSGGGHFTDIRNLSTLRLRLGYAANTSLVYVAGGLAYGDVRDGAHGFLIEGEGSATRFGWALGAGVEWAFAPRWSLKAEYLHVDLGDRHDYSVPLFGDVDVRLTADIARIGVNYSFGSDSWSGMLGGR